MPVRRAVLDDERFRHVVVDDRNVLMLRVLLFPRRRFHRGERRTDDDLYVFTAKPTRRAAAVHRGVSAAEDDHGLSDLARVLKRHAFEPVDADMDIRSRLLRVPADPAVRGHAELRCRQRPRRNPVSSTSFKRRDVLLEMRVDAEVENVIDLFVEDRFRQAKRRNLR